MALATRRNDALNPLAVQTAAGVATGFAQYGAGTGEAGTTMCIAGATDGPLLSSGRITTYIRRSITTAKTGSSTGWSSFQHRAPNPGVAGDVRRAAALLRYTSPDGSPLTGRMRTQVFTSGGSGGTYVDGPPVTLVSGQWTLVESTVTATDGFASVGWWFYHGSIQIPVAGSTYDATGAIVGDGEVFAGSTPASSGWSYAWEGAPNASASIATEVPALTIAAVAQPTSASVAITVRGGAPGTPLYVLRRDTSGTGIVRETSEGTVVWPALGDTLTLTDYEARQGESTQYLLTDGDGSPVASTSLTLPMWGTWLKSPGRPYRNARAYYVSDGEATLTARRLVVDIEDAAQRVVFARRRSTPSGNVVLLTQTADQASALALLLSDGLPLMLDTPSSWGVPYRYISVGDVGRSRAYDFEGLNLTAQARLWTLGDVVSTAAPQGVPTIDPGRTYADLPTLFATYVAIPATTQTYEELATGQES